MSLLRKLFLFTFQAIYTLKVLILLFVYRIYFGSEFFETKERKKPKVLEEYQEHYVQLSSVKLHYVQTGDDDKPLLLMVHGFPEFWYSWRYQLEEFKNDYRCVAIDQRGYNLSDKPVGVHNYDIDKLADDVKEVIEKLGYDKAFLVGHDWGAAVAWRTALKHPNVVSKLVILNVPHPKAFQTLFRSNLQQFLSSWYMFFFQSPILPEIALRALDFKMIEKMFVENPAGIKNTKNFTKEDLEAWKYTFGQSYDAFTYPLNYYRAALSRPPSKETIVEPPTLIVWGTADVALVKKGAENSLQYCSNGQLKFVENASHWVQQDEPEIVNQYIREFLEN